MQLMLGIEDTLLGMSGFGRTCVIRHESDAPRGGSVWVALHNIAGRSLIDLGRAPPGRDQRAAGVRQVDPGTDVRQCPSAEPDLDIDRVRNMIGRWRDEPEIAGLLARSIALAAARTHLTAGHDVVIPQFPWPGGIPRTPRTARARDRCQFPRDRPTRQQGEHAASLHRAQPGRGRSRARGSTPDAGAQRRP